MPIKEVEKGVKHIIDNEGSILGIVIRSLYKCSGVNFFTSKSSPFQLGFICQPKGYNSKPHTHTLLPKDNIIRDVQEVVFVVAGVFEVDFYGGGKTVLETVVLSKGDTAFFVSGGHGYRVEEDCKVVTVKQGPYPGEKVAKKYIT